jgi:hypothetical protein
MRAVVLVSDYTRPMTVDEQLGRARQRLTELQTERDRVVAAARAVIEAWPEPAALSALGRLRDELEAIGAPARRAGAMSEGRRQLATRVGA